MIWTIGGRQKRNKGNDKTDSGYEWKNASPVETGFAFAIGI